MTKKDFEFIAATIKSTPDAALRTQMAHLFADKLATANPKFKKDIFLKACLA